VPDLTNDQQTLALAAIAAVALLAFLIAIFSVFRMRRTRRELTVFRGDSGERDVIAGVGRVMRRLEEMDGRVDGLGAAQQELAAIGRFAIQRFSLVRYDAFEDMGGRLSFSAALLDDHGDGIVITSINGRTETRTYAKPVSNLSSEHNLSDEERHAIAEAAAGAGRAKKRESVSN
jgi:hypothetical protein